jgi:hypothetical protein
MTHELICDNKAGNSSTGAQVVQHAKKALIPAVASLCLAAAFHTQAQDAARTAQPVPASPAEGPAEVVLPMTVITPTPEGARGAQGDTRFRPNATIVGNCGTVSFKNVLRTGMINDYQVTVIGNPALGLIEGIYYTASTWGDIGSGWVPVGPPAPSKTFNFMLFNPFNVTAMLNGYVRTTTTTACYFLPNPTPP